MRHEKLTHGKMSKEIRKSLNITQERLSKKLGISRGYLSEIENEIKIPSVRLRIEIKTMYLQHCAFRKPKPLVEIMTPEKPKSSWLMRLIRLFKRK